MSHLPLIAVVAMGRNGAIGRDNALPWRMPSDLARFRALTMGKPMIMGRRTFESIGRALPGRESIVVSRREQDTLAPGVFGAATPELALRLARERAAAMNAQEVALVGGASLFQALAPQTDRLYLTVIDLAPEADTFHPVPDPFVWREVARSRPERRADDEADCLFLEYARA